MFRIIVNNHALILVPVLYLSWFARALYNVSWKRSFAISWSRVRLTANGFNGSALCNNNSLNSAADIKFCLTFNTTKLNSHVYRIFPCLKIKRKKSRFAQQKKGDSCLQ